MEISVFIHGANVTSMKPAVFIHRISCFLRALVISLHYIVTPNQNLSLFNLQLHIRNNFSRSDGLKLHRILIIRNGNARRRLRLAVGYLQMLQF